jgi:YVTN family beta-propeller protein
MTSGNGLLWVLSGGSILRIDPQTNQLVGDPIQPGIQIEDIAFGDEALWVTTVASGDLGAPSDTDAVSRIDPKTGQVLSTVKVARAPVSLAFTPDAVWVVNFGMDGDAVVRIDPQTNQLIGDPIQTGRAPISLAAGEGSIWVANHDAHTVTRIDPATDQVLANISVPSEPHRVAFGEGAVWVANWHINSVTRIDPQTNEIVGEPIPIGFHAGNMAAGLGSVWVTSDYRGPGDGAAEDVVLVRIDPQKNQAVETIPLGGHPIDVEIAGDAVWVSVQGSDKIVRINP